MIFYKVFEGLNCNDTNYVEKRFLKIKRALNYARKSKNNWVDLTKYNGTFEDWDYIGTINIKTGILEMY